MVISVIEFLIFIDYNDIDSLCQQKVTIWEIFPLTNTLYSDKAYAITAAVQTIIVKENLRLLKNLAINYNLHIKSGA